MKKNLTELRVALDCLYKAYPEIVFVIDDHQFDDVLSVSAVVMVKYGVYRCITVDLRCSADEIFKAIQNSPEFLALKNLHRDIKERYEIKKVIFNDPATIVLWKNGTKTVVKVKDGEAFDKWTGLAMCHMKKAYGKDFHSLFREFCEED